MYTSDACLLGSASSVSTQAGAAKSVNGIHVLL